MIHHDDSRGDASENSSTQEAGPPVPGALVPRDSLFKTRAYDDEPARVSELRSLQIPYTKQDERFDQITRWPGWRGREHWARTEWGGGPRQPRPTPACFIPCGIPQ